MNKPVIPFGWLPGHWGLRGKTRARAQAEYELTGEELDQKLLEIDLGDDPHKLALAMLELRLKQNKINQYDYEKYRCSLMYPEESTDKRIALLDIDLSHEKITQPVYDRKRADILKEPWVGMPRIHWDPTGSGRTWFELDYNEYFLEFLKANGYEGDNDDDMVNLWLNDICISISEEITGLDAEYITPTRRTDDES